MQDLVAPILGYLGTILVDASEALVSFLFPRLIRIIFAIFVICENAWMFHL